METKKKAVNEKTKEKVSKKMQGRQVLKKVYRTFAGYCKRLGSGKVLGPFKTEEEAEKAYTQPPIDKNKTKGAQNASTSRSSSDKKGGNGLDKHELPTKVGHLGGSHNDTGPGNGTTTSKIQSGSTKGQKGTGNLNK